MQTYPCATLWQIHSAEIAALDTEQTPWDDWRYDWPHRSYSLHGQELVWTIKPRRKADAILTRQRGVALALSFADCVPLLFYDPPGRLSRWPMLDGVVRRVASPSRPLRPCSNSLAANPPIFMLASVPLSAHAARGLGAGTRPVYRPGIVQRAANGGTLPLPGAQSATFTTKRLPERESLRLDLWATNRNQLLLAGSPADHIEWANICPGCSTDHFFSHRVEQGKTGRFPVLFAFAPRAQRVEATHNLNLHYRSIYLSFHSFS